MSNIHKIEIIKYFSAFSYRKFQQKITAARILRCMYYILFLFDLHLSTMGIIIYIEC